MDMVPLSVAKQAVQEALESNPALDDAISTITEAMNKLSNTFENND